jgi:hypothetical protein
VRQSVDHHNLVGKKSNVAMQAGPDVTSICNSAGEFVASPRGETSNYWVEPLAEEGTGQLLESLEEWGAHLETLYAIVSGRGGIGRSVESAAYEIA